MKLRKLLLIGGCGVGVLLTGLVVFAASIDIDDYRDVISDEVEAATGRELTINGDTALELGFTPRITVEGVSFGNAPWGSRPNMATIERLDVELKLLPLLFGGIEIRRLVLVGADILLERNADGETNWTIATAEEAASGDGAETEEPEAAGELPQVHKLRIEKSRLTFIDGTAVAHTVVVDRLKLSADGLSSPLDIDLKAIVDDRVVELKGSVADIGDLMADRPIDIDVEGIVGTANFSVVGSIQQPFAPAGLDVAVTASSPSLAEFSALAGTALPAGPLSVTATIREANNDYEIDDLVLGVGQSDLSGRISFSLAGERPRIDGNLSSRRLDLADLRPEAEAAATDASEPAGNDGRLFSDEPLPLDWLKSIDANLQFDGVTVVNNGVTLSDVVVQLEALEGRLTLAPVSAILSGGSIAGNAAVDVSGKAPTVSLRLSANQVDGDALLGALGLTDVLGGGKANLLLDVAGAGASLHDLMSTLNGAAGLDMAGGHITNRFARIMLSDLTSLVSSEGGAAANCIAVGFTIKKGVAANRTAVVDTPGAAIVGSGKIDLGKETIDMRFEPVAKDVSLAQLAIPVDVTGSLASPTVEPDAVAGATKAVGNVASLAAGTLGGVLNDVTGAAASGEPKSIPACGGAIAALPAQNAAVPEATADTSTGATSSTAKKKKQSTSNSTSAAKSDDQTVIQKSGDLLDDIGDGIGDFFSGGSGGTSKTGTQGNTK